jgi:protein-S-isoprenylcysteine O-methyltransferase Ste14
MEQTDRLIRKRIGQVVVQTVASSIVLFAIANDLRWTMAWMYLGIGILITSFNFFVLIRINPEVVAERARQSKGLRRWDKFLLTLYGLMALALPVVAGLDRRFGWSASLSPAVHGVSAVLLLLSNGFVTWAMAVNAHFSKTVHVQEERGHTVTTSGPYRFVRHPGYSGWLVSWLVTPLVLGTWSVYAPVCGAIAILVIRTLLEDKTLQEELPGYVEYTQQTCYRLVPGIW